MTIAAAGAPSWTDILTAIGTVGAVVVAVGITVCTEWRSGKRVKEERARSDRAIEGERAHGRVQLEEERRLTRERDQLAEAYAVQVASGEQAVGHGGPVATGEGVEAEVKRLAVMVVNHGSFTITGVEAQLCLSGKSMQQYHSYQRVTGFEEIPSLVTAGFFVSPERAVSKVLTPFDGGIRFETADIHKRHLSGPYPVVRWTDHWGTRWEHKGGVVQPVSDDQPWEP